MRKMRVAAVIMIVLALSVSAVMGGGGAGAAPAEVRLPTPTGGFAIGRDVLQLVDDSRRDPWQPERARELMVDMFYPARAAVGEPAPYASAAQVRALLAGVGSTGEGAEALSGAETHGVVGAPPAAGVYPLVVLSPGLTAPRYTLTAVAEELSSRGYVVAAVDHAGESFGAEFPGGRMSTCIACEHVEDTGGFALVARTRARDIGFLLDRITGPAAVWPHARLIDTTRIGMAGQSIGGASAAATMAADARVRAGVNMDGSLPDVIPEGGLGDRPFLLLGADGESGPGGGEPSWDAAWQRLRGWKRWMTLVGADHNSFTDIPALAEQVGVPGDAVLPAGRAVELTRAIVAAFFDQQLRAIAQPLLDGPDPAWPELRFHNR